MGTEVLRPQDCLVDKLRFSPPAFNRRKTLFVNGYGLANQNPNFNNNSYYYSSRRPVNVNRPDRKRSLTKDFQFQHRKPAAAGGGGGADLPDLTTPRRSRSSGVLLQNSGVSSTKPVTNLHHHPNPEVESGRVTILRRGQSLDSLESSNNNNNNLQKNDSVRKSLKLSSGKTMMVAGGGGGCADVYAGSAIFVSPSPSSLPLPSFFSNNNKKIESDVSATRDLRRLLGLE